MKQAKLSDGRLVAALAVALVAPISCQCARPSSQPVATKVDQPPKAFVPVAKCAIQHHGLEAEADGGEEDPAADELLVRTVTAAFDKAYDAQQYEEALACAQELSRLTPDDSAGHLDRGLALEAIGQDDEALAAYDRALAIDPDDPDVLLAAAEFEVDQGTNDALETAALYAKRGRESEQRLDAAAELAATEAQALNGIGRSSEALAAAESALALSSEEVDAMRERGIALFELLRFDESDRALAEARAHLPDDAKTFYYSALLSERLGRAADARQYFSTATRLDPEAYPAEVDVNRDEFQKILDDEIAALPTDERVALASTEFSWTDLPAQEDLLAGDPVLSPTIVGVFRPGLDGHKDAILVYRKNLLHIVRSRDELKSEVRDTILHELGHLNGEDDDELRDRGL